MGVIERFKAAVVRRFSTSDSHYPAQLSGGKAYSGEVVSEASALALSAVWGCVNLIAGTIATLPLMVYRTGTDGKREVAKSHPLYRVLHDSPNYDQTAVDFWEWMSAAIELRGNAYARIARGDNGRITALYPVAPQIVSVERLNNGALQYEWTEDGQHFKLTDRDVLHIRGFGGNPLGGLSTLQFGRGTFGLAQAQDRAASETFRNGLRPSGALTFAEFLSKENREIAETKLVEKFAGAQNAGRPMVLEGGTKWESLSITPEDAQMLESRGFSLEEICRFFGVPPFMIGHTVKSTSWGTGIEQQTIGFQKFTLRRRLKRIEQSIAKQLLSAADRSAGVTIEFNIEGLLRADTEARAAFYTSMTQIGAMTINEVRGLENLPPIEGGNVARMQMQNVPITEAGNDDPA
ncbi:phage portal protein [Phaeobacter inhibens]|uniref:Phage portal protein n=1 Tax=Phaeobacter inhibens TaxID=221822 RepID=A0ABM6RDM8_9RHOB|nr:phage portal protein [Phaeobacter inhibens]AUQ49937.1 phage portal protein [Phaeobacter inhibens]AUQ94493.1 phage portal protein [Phaeobacter inhibens]AUR19742.1 phage portal protein [Phaeobacter inhibens]